MAITAATIDRLKSQLLTSGLSQQNQALFQIINSLIDATRQSLTGVSVTTGGSSGSVGAIGPQGPPGPAVLMPSDYECEYPEIIPILGNGLLPLPLTWIDVAFNAANFTANGAMTWTVAVGDQLTYKYAIFNDTMFLQVTIQTSTVGGVASSILHVAIPDGWIAKGSAFFPYQGIDTASGGAILSVCQISDGGTTVDCFRDVSASNWPLSIDTTHIRFSVVFQVRR